MFERDIYECPINEQIGELKTMMANEHDKMIVRAVQQIGIEIDQESLVQAVYNDRKRYEAAYKKGYEDCEKNYKDLLSRVSMLAEDFYKEMLAQTGIAKRKE